MTISSAAATTSSSTSSISIVVGTHSGPFHADDALAVATLRLALADREVRVIRSRDPKVLATADILVDVGGICSPAEQKFDHHMREVPQPRANGVPYSSAGLVWRSYGLVLARCEKVWDAVDVKLFQCVDALDCGKGSRSFDVAGTSLSHFTFSDIIHAMSTGKVDFDAEFNRAVELAELILQAVIRQCTEEVAAKDAAQEAIDSALDSGTIVVLDEFKPVLKYVAELSSSAQFLIFPQGDDWLVQCVPGEKEFSQRTPFPEAWGGLRDIAIQEKTGIPDAVFVHPGRFIGGTKSRQTAIKMARAIMEVV